MNERIKQVRISKNMTQTKFAEELGVSMANVQSYELGRRNPSSAFIQLLCNKFGVNETWLLTGDGEMYAPKSKAQEIASITTNLLREPSSFRSNLISVIAQLSDEQLEALEAIIDEMAKIKGEN